MKNYFLLVKAVLATSMSSKKSRNNQLKKGSRIPQLLSALLITIIFGMSFYFNLSQYTFSQLSLEDISHYVMPSISFIIIFCFLFSLSLSFNVFFLTNNEQFLCLPITGIRLLSARFFLHLFNCFCYGAALILVNLLMVSIVLKLGAIAIIYSILISLVLLVSIGLLSFIIACIISYFIDLKTHTTFYNFIVIILAILGGISLSLTTTLAPSIDMSTSLSESTTKLQQDLLNYFNNTRFLNFVGHLPTRGILLENVNDYLSLLYLVLILFTLLGITYLSCRYLYLKSLSNRQGKKKKQLLSKDNLSKKFSIIKPGSFSIYLKRDLQLLKRNPSLLISSLISTITIFISLIVTGIFIARAFQPEMIDKVQLLFVYLIAHIFSLEALFNPLIGYSAVSLEGKDFLLIKTFPIDKNKYLLSKIIPSTSLSLFLSMIISTIMTIVFKLPSLYSLGFYITTITCCLANSLFSFLLGIIFARFSYDNSLELINRGIGPLLVSLFSFLLPLISIAFDFIFYFFANDLFYLGFILSGFIYSSIIVLLAVLIKKKFEKLLSTDLNIS